jgi:hypothetical protein
MTEMQADAILATSDLRRVGATLDHAGDDDRIARDTGLRGHDDSVADAKSGIGGEPTVYRYRAWAVLRAPKLHDAWAVLRRGDAEGDEEEKESEADSHGAER